MSRNSTLLDRAAERTTDVVEAAVEATQDFIENTAKPFVEDTAKPAFHDAAAKTAPIVAAAAAVAAERAAEAKEYAEAKSQELTGHPKKSRRGRKLLLFAILGGLAAGAAFLAKKAMSGSDDWTSAAPVSTPENPAETFSTDESVEDLTTPTDKPPYSSN